MADRASPQDQLADGDRYRQLQERLARARKDEALRAHHQMQIFRLTETVATELERNEDLANSLADEEHDVERLEGWSWKRLQAMVGEGVDEALVRERMEAKAAADTFEESTLELAFLRKEIDRREATISGLGDVDGELDTARADIEGYVNTSLPRVAAELARLDERDGELLRELVEIGEALTAGEIAEGELVALRASLRKAERTSNFDIWAGGALVSIYKRNQLQASNQQTRAVAHAMENFDRELSDTAVAGISIDLDGALRPWVFDVFFDNFFTDLSVHRKINETQRQLEGVIREVGSTLKVLSNGRDAIHTLLEALMEQRLEVLSRPQTSL